MHVWKAWGTDFNLTFPTVDNITDMLKCLGKGAHLYKIDVSRAFRHIKMDPSDYDYGTRHGTQICQRVSDAVHFMMRRDGFDIINYVDNFVGFEMPSITCGAFDHLLALLRHLGLDVSESISNFVPHSYAEFDPSRQLTLSDIKFTTTGMKVAIK